MTHFAEVRKFRYEIYVLESGHWNLAQTVDDEREQLGRPFTANDHRLTESNVLSQGESLLATGRYQGVKVVRERIAPGGTSVTSEIFHRETTNPPPQPKIGIRSLRGGFPDCRSLDDLVARPACYSLSVVLREFLEPLRISAIELLYSPSNLQRLQRASALQRGVCHELAQRQEEVAKEPLPVREKRLMELFDRALAQALDLAGNRKLPNLADNDVAAAAAAAGWGGDAAGWRHEMAFSLTRRFHGQNKFLEKLEFALDAIEQAVPADVRDVLDGFVAGWIDSPTVIKELLGMRENMAAVLGLLAEIGNGECIRPEISPVLVRINAMIRAGHLAQGAGAIWLRIMRELESVAPLARNAPAREWWTTVNLTEHLLAVCPPEMSENINQVTRQRLRRLREQE